MDTITRKGPDVRPINLESVEIHKGDSMDMGTPTGNQVPMALPKSTSKNAFSRLGSKFKASTKGLKGFGPRRAPRAKSGAFRGLKSVRFIDKKKINKDSLKDAERRFHQMAVDGMLRRDKFGTCVGIKKYAYMIVIKHVYFFFCYIFVRMLVNFLVCCDVCYIHLMSYLIFGLKRNSR